MGARAIVGALLLGALGACMPKTAQRRPFKAPYDTAKKEQIWQGAVAVLQEQNYPIQLLDQASGTITTGEVSGFTSPCNDGTGECPARESVSLTVATNGTLLLNVNRQVYYAGLPGFGMPPRWDGVSFAKDVAAAEARQKELADLILARAMGLSDEPAPASAAPASETPAPESAP